MSSRGIVIVPRFTYDGSSLVFPGIVGIEPTDLRYFLLYWDKLDFPQNNIIHIANSPDIQFLIEEGVLTRSQVRVSGGSANLEAGYVAAQFEVFRQKNEVEPGLWSLSQTTNLLYVPEELSVEQVSIEIEIYKALPVPSENVSLDDVLEFKKRHNSELLQLRSALDDLYLNAVDSADVVRARNSAVDRLEMALEAVNKAANESFSEKLLASAKVELNGRDLMVGLAAGSTLSSQFSLAPEIGAIIGAAGASLKFELGPMKTVKGLPDELLDFAYLYRIEQQLLNT